jgi:predicted nuclease with TOPRIM domain
MDQDQHELRQALKNLHEHLAEADALDPELRSRLERLDAEIHALLEEHTRDQDRAGSLLEQAQAVDAHFAANHPRLEAVFREVVNALARMGI